jgi:protein-disulfide isomerase
MKKGLIFVLSAVALLAVFVIGNTYYKTRQARKIESVAQTDSSVFVREYSQTLGSDDAKVVISEFLDPGCETCRAMHPFLKNMIDDNPGKIKLVIRYAPLHHGSDEMVKILEASKNQGKYWETLEVMFEAQPYWASHSNPQPEKIWQYLPQAGLDIDKLKEDMRSPEIERIVQQDIADARALNVRKTPGYFVNGRPLVNFGYEPLFELVKSEYIKNYPN